MLDVQSCAGHHAVPHAAGHVAIATEHFNARKGLAKGAFDIVLWKSLSGTRPAEPLANHDNIRGSPAI